MVGLEIRTMNGDLFNNNYILTYLLNLQNDHYILQFTSYGGVEPFSVPDLPWSDGH